MSSNLLIENAGKIITLPVEGMTCASCVARVEKAIKKVDGVGKVSVNLATEKATFEIDPSKINYRDIVEKIESAGYKVDVSSLEQKKGNALPENKDKTDFETVLQREFIFAVILTIPILILNMGMMWETFHNIVPLSMDYINKILLILTTPVVFIPGKRFYKIFWANLKHFSADMNSLVAVGTGAAFIYSLTVTLFPATILIHGELPHVYFDTTAVIITLILMGRWLESRAKQKTNSSIKKLMELKPKTALVIRNGIETEIKLEDLIIGDRVIVKPGSKIPADGIIKKGNSVIEESMITGESIPVEKSNNDKVIGGTINKSGYLEFLITAVGENSVLGQIIKMVEEAQGSKAPIQNLADKVAAVFVPVVIVIAILTFIIWLIIGNGENIFSHALINFVAVLIIACPCALGLATPTAIMVGTGKGAQLGILIKNGESLERAHKISTVIFDKTGTITEGRPKVTDIITFNSVEESLLQFTASVEKKSEHPVASAVVDYAAAKNIKLIEPDSFESIAGKGIISLINGSEIIAGNLNMMNEKDIDLSQYTSEIEKLHATGKTLIFTAIDKKLKGIFLIEDPIKKTSAVAIADLKKMGIKTIMLTGDNKATAEVIAKKAGVDSYEAEIMPEDKAKVVTKYQNKNEVVAMVGDGINDAPALAQSDVGIAIGSGTDIAIETGSIVLISGDLNGVVDAIKLSQKTIKTIKQNLFWAFIYNTIGIPLAAIGLLNPMFAALAMSLSSVSVISNSLRLRSYKLKGTSNPFANEQ